MSRTGRLPSKPWKRRELKPDLALARGNLGIALLVCPPELRSKNGVSVAANVAQAKLYLAEAAKLAGKDPELVGPPQAALLVNSAVAELASGDIGACQPCADGGRKAARNLRQPGRDGCPPLQPGHAVGCIG